MFLFKEVVYEWCDDIDRHKIGPLSFNIGNSEKIGLFGYSGSGKSTILRLALEELKPHSGSVEINNVKVIYHDQYNKLIPWITARKNTHINEPDLGKYYDEVMEACGINKFGNKMPNQLSGGQKARTSLARTLIQRYDILLLDEPFTGIDIYNQNKLIDLIHSSSNDSSILITTHDPSNLIQLCHKIFCLKKVGKSHTIKEFILNKSISLLSPEKRRNHASFIGEIQRLQGFLYE